MKIEHCAIYVSNLEKAKEFFVKYFCARPNAGYTNPVTQFSSYFLTFEDGARLEIMQKPAVAPKTNTSTETFGYNHIAFSLGSKAAVDSLTCRLKNDGFCIFSAPRTTGDGYYESCIIDFDGNKIELCE